MFVNPGADFWVVFLGGGEIPFSKVKCASAGIDAGDTRRCADYIPDGVGSGVRVVVKGFLGWLVVEVHGFYTKSDNCNVSVVLEEVVLVTEEFAVKFGIFAFEGAGDKDEVIALVALFDAGSEEIDVGAFGLEVNNVAMDGGVLISAVGLARSDKNVGEFAIVWDV
jgi:hypothetical protein